MNLDKKIDNDFYEVLPIICANLTNDSKVSEIKKVFEKLAVRFARKVVEESVWGEDNPRLGSENQDEYVAYANGYNTHRTQTLAKMEEILDNK